MFTIILGLLATLCAVACTGSSGGRSGDKNMERKAWFCPSCQKHHGPHVDTCPGVSGAQPAPAPGNPVVIPQPMPYRREPQPWETPWTPYWPQVTCGIYQPRFDPDKIVVVN